MRWSDVTVEAITVALPDERVSSAELEARLRPLYRALNVLPGQLEALTGIRERRVWPPGTSMASVAARAGQQALDASGVSPSSVGCVVYCGVNRDNLEPATACAVAETLNVSGSAMVYDVSNACLGALNGMVEVANRIQLGQLEAGLVVSAESSRVVVDAAIARLNAQPTLENFRLGLATLTGGSGATAVLLTKRGFGTSTHRLVGGVAHAEPRHHRLCRWGPERGLLGESVNGMQTEAAAVLEHGVDLGAETWRHFLAELGWRPAEVDRVIAHQVGGKHREEVLKALEVDPAKDFSTFDRLGNMGTVALPATAALAAQAGFLRPGDRVAMLGIGSGLNCLMLGVEW